MLGLADTCIARHLDKREGTLPVLLIKSFGIDEFLCCDDVGGHALALVAPYREPNHFHALPAACCLFQKRFVQFLKGPCAALACALRALKTHCIQSKKGALGAAGLAPVLAKG